MLKLVLKYLLITSGVAAVGLGLGLIDAVAVDGSSMTLMGVLGMLLFFFSPAVSGFWFWYKHRKVAAAGRKAAEAKDQKDHLRRRFLERQRLIDAIDRHRSPLTRNLERALKKNDYGALVADTTAQALAEFFASIDLDLSIIDESEASDLVFEQVNFRRNEDAEVGFDSGNLPFDGHSFEKWVAEALIGFGWEAEVTAGSGDQGIDVIAIKNGKKIGLQCKLYSSAVGNKAVQEAHSGKVYYDAHEAGVLSNASYTASAKDLAEVTGVKLLSHHDIPHLYEKMFGAPAVS
ncbi:restriction endonuclease [Leisingera caerulea]|uniref:Restriction endonuclease n=1 Tax=Leisingera caerulea TaxID=506591 RepID=A0ABY5WXB4_LEICA|nr:restriction endonuclease [Leisingera caerulea]UWQ58763.1 restriction endonuclease [Leisingera caerulea]